jgi:hypothetical protein
VVAEKATRREGAWKASFAAVEVHAMIVEPGCSSNRRGASVGGGRKRERPRATQKKNGNLASGRVGDGIAASEYVQVAWNTKLARFGDGR